MGNVNAYTTANDFAAGTLEYNQEQQSGQWEFEVKVWNRSFDDPLPERRNPLIISLEIVDLPTGIAYHLSTVNSEDHPGTYGTPVWSLPHGCNSEGYDGYMEYDIAGRYCPSLPPVHWSCNTGIYDERCLGSSVCDARRLRTSRHTMPQISIFSYLLGPVTLRFNFNIDIFEPKVGPRIRITQKFIGGNGGNPTNPQSRRDQEQFVIQFG
jgi:hypothetical protein